MNTNKNIVLIGISVGFLIFIWIVVLMILSSRTKTKSNPSLVIVSPTPLSFFNGTTNNNQNQQSGSSKSPTISISPAALITTYKAENIQLNKSALTSQPSIKTDLFDMLYNPETNSLQVLLKGDKNTAEKAFLNYMQAHNFVGSNTVLVNYSIVSQNTTGSNSNASSSGINVPTATPTAVVINPNDSQSMTSGLFAIFAQQKEAIQNRQPIPNSTNDTSSTFAESPVPTPKVGPLGTTASANGTNVLSDIFLGFFGNITSHLQVNAPAPTAVPTQTPSNSGSSPSIPGQQGASISVPSSIFSDYGLPQPSTSGTNSYPALLQKIRNNSKATWAVQNMLNGERLYIQKGGKIYPYLTTVWLWAENGAAGWPDVYEINCNDNRSGFVSAVSFYCPVTNFQVAGYQVNDHRADFIRLYRLFYTESDLKNVLQKVVDNSTNAGSNSWSYVSGSQQGRDLMTYLNGTTVPNVSLSDIASGSDIFDRKKQFFTLILGKDPTIVAALNGIEVYSDDLPAILKGTKHVSWANYMLGATYKQLMSNMLAALIIFDKGSLP